MAEAKKPANTKPLEKPPATRPKSQKEQSQRFIETARALECDETGEKFDAAFEKIAKHKPAHSK